MKNVFITIGEIIPNLPVLFGKKIITLPATKSVRNDNVLVSNKAFELKQKEAAYTKATQSKRMAAKARALEAKHGFIRACMFSRSEIGATSVLSQTERLAELKDFAIALGTACRSFFQAPSLESGQAILESVKGLKGLTMAMKLVLRRVELLVAKLITKAMSAKAITTSISSFVMDISWAAVNAAQEVNIKLDITALPSAY